MYKNDINRDFLKVFLKCSTCNNYISYNAEMCEYCGSVISYDDEKQQCYISGRVCFKCGFENKPESLYCSNCKSKFTIVCPKCKHEIDVTDIYCKRCGFRMDEFYVENEVVKRLNLAKTKRSKKTGLYIGGLISLIAALFFTFLSFRDKNGDIKRTAFIIGAITFYVLFIVVVRSFKKGLSYEDRNI